MTMMAQATPARLAAAAGSAAGLAALRHRRMRLSTSSAAAAHASGHVRAAISEWRVPVDGSVAGILASDLIINAITCGSAASLMLSIRCTGSQFRVEVHDASVSGDSWEAADSSAEAKRGLLLAAALAAESGHYRTPAGRAVYYALVFEPVAAAGGELSSPGAASGDGEP